ncbi:endonuclease/exonuclease/phosphatase family protein [Aeoliella mucimassa]|uniref:Endonuclease/exonuclease/phosphatase domain-containing protein n=1 Tax=Aeoliella mucimassa TaxID=2527972 RepID=A0A518ALP1_9BACT|nr:endonuclease/exonuclease/phosphatase family protein [Aeoliella mucimassa]QDU55650.1 hypothetical protein Pan181_18430 [Aeoliella mucimassa]
MPTLLLPACLLITCLVAAGARAEMPAKDDSVIRVATYNVSFYRNRAGQLLEDLQAEDAQAQKIAEVIRRVQPDMLLLNEFDYQAPNHINTAMYFSCEFFYLKREGLSEVRLARPTYLPVNTGVPSGLDIDGDGSTDGPNDCFGYGRYPGQYGMAAYARWRPDMRKVRTFQKFLWKDMPGAKLPVDPKTGESYYSDEILNVFRLSSKSHWDVPIKVKTGDQTWTLHLLCSHPTPPVFDGPEDRNGRRNHDEIRLWADYIDPARSDYLVDDQGHRGGLEAGAHFVILGDLNADPVDGDSAGENINQLLNHPLINASSTPTSEGAVEASRLQAELNAKHHGDASHDTADFSGDGHGNLRVDYVLPSQTLQVVHSGVFWPKPGEPGSEAIRATDHRLVWVDLKLPPADQPAAD